MKRHALSLSFLLLTTSLVQADSDAEMAFAAMVADANGSGWLTMDVGSTHYQSEKDLLTAQNVVYRLNWSMPDFDEATASSRSEKEKNDFSFSVELTIPTMTGQGLMLKEDGVSFDSFTYDGFTFDVQIDAKGEDSDMRLAGKALGQEKSFDGFQPFVGTFSLSPSRPIGSVLDYIRPILTKQTYGRYVSDGYRLTQYSGNGMVTEQREIGPLTLEGYANGRMDFLSLDYQKGTLSIAAEAGNQEEMLPFDTIQFDAGKTVYEGYDIGAIWAAFDPGMPPIEGKKTILKRAETDGMNASANGFFELSAGSASQKDITLTQPEDYLVPLLDTMLSQDLDPEKLPPEEQQALIKAVFDLFRSVSYGLGEIKDVKGTVTIPEGDMKGQSVSLSLDAMRLSNLNSHGIGELSLSGMGLTGPDPVSASLDRFAIENLEFPTYAAIEHVIKTSMAGQEPSPSDLAKLSPNAIKLVLNGLKVTDPEANIISANQLLIEADKQGLAVPVLIKGRVSDLSIPKNLIQHPMASVLMSQLNLDRLLVNKDVTLRWDEASESIKLDPFNVELAEIAKLSGSVAMGGILRSYLDNPEQAQAAIATGTILPSSLTLTNLGGVDAMLNLAGGMAGMGPEQVRLFAESQTEALLSAFTKPDFAQLVASQVKVFLSNPDTLTLILKPGAPVPIMQIIGAASQAPQAIPDILKIDVMANQ